MSFINPSFFIDESYWKLYYIKKDLMLNSSLLKEESDERVEQVGIQCLRSLELTLPLTPNEPDFSSLDQSYETVSQFSSKAEEKKIGATLISSSVTTGNVSDGQPTEDWSYWQNNQETSDLFCTELICWNGLNDEENSPSHSNFSSKTEERLTSEAPPCFYATPPIGLSQDALVTTNKRGEAPNSLFCEVPPFVTTNQKKRQRTTTNRRRQGQEYWKNYYLQNKERILKRHKAYIAEKKDNVAKAQRTYYLKNQKEILARVKEYRITHKKEILARSKAYQIKKKEKAVGKNATKS